VQTWVREELSPGDRLPPERELVERFGVSRGSIRDALRRLQQDGLVETRHGLGSIVAAPVQHLAATPLASTLKDRDCGVADLMDFRRILEPPLAFRAALRATAADRVVMREILVRQAAKVQQGQPAVEEDMQFHHAIARATKNAVVLKLLDTLMNLLFVTREETFQSEVRSRRSLAGHRAILKAIEAGTGVAAAAAMQQHLDQVEALIQTDPPCQSDAPDQRKKAQS
jgi:GntR family transcriptional repressor for pyruvate dehydrogenase complex